MPSSTSSAGFMWWTPCCSPLLLRGEQEVIEEVTYYAGLDLGQVSDFSAFSVVEKKVLRPKEHYAVLRPLALKHTI